MVDPVLAIKNANEFGVTKLICVGCDENDSQLAVDFANQHKNVWASIGLHPHDAKMGQAAFDKLTILAKSPKVVAIGECGLDYFYNHSTKEDQEKALIFQIKLALANNLPIIFHVRDAFEDFWPIFDKFSAIRGIIHSFTASDKQLNEALERGLCIGLNGIMTFTKDRSQLETARKVPLENLILETDAPFLTPKPLRGKVNEPKNVVLTAEFLAQLRAENLGDLATASTANAEKLFGI